MKWIILVVLFSSTALLAIEKVDSAKIIIDKMFISIDKIKTISFIVKNSERINGKILVGEQFVKYNANPEKIYIKLIKPTPGPEVLYVKGQNNNNAIYNPNSFPYIKLNLDPYGEMMRKNNHHTIFELSLRENKKLIEYLYLNYYYAFTYNGVLKIKDKKYYMISIDMSDYKFLNYTIQSNENIRDIAKKRFLNEYKILEINPFIDFFDYSEKGKVIKIPNYYAKKIEIFIDESNYLPVSQRVYDEIGLFEKYDYTSITINPIFSESDFSSSFLGKTKIN